MNSVENTQHIIVIDDDPAITSMYKMLLKSLGHRVDSAEHPDEATYKIQEQENSNNPFTVAIIDMQFEGSGEMGKEMTKRIKQQYPYIATVISTSMEHAPQNVLQLRDEIGVDQFMQKSDIDMDKPYRLNGVIERAVARVQQQIENAQIPYNPGNIPSQYPSPSKILSEPIFGPPNTSDRFQCDAFMIMPFHDPHWQVYEKAVIPAVSNKDYKIIHGANMFTTRHVMSDVWSGIFASKFVIADCTGQNANVFYELGMAHTLGKPAIPITQDSTDVPFDIRSYRYIAYTTTPEGLVKLRVDLEEAIEGLKTDLGLE